MFAADVDEDGDLDVLSASFSDDKIAWYENTDGQGTFGPQRIISTAAVRPTSVFAADLDCDGDMDVLSASFSDDKIAWYENADGFGGFGPQQVISVDADAAHSVFSADLDGDGDLDVLSASSSDNKVAWHENMNGRGDFGREQVISLDSDGARSVFAIDLDGDSDIDVLSASGNEISWHENTTGLGDFGARQIIASDADGTRSVFAADLDGDGDVDVISASELAGKIAWYGNLRLVTSVRKSASVTDEFALQTNYPNPFNPETVIRYELSSSADVTLEIYNLVGQRVTTLVSQKMSSGAHSIAWRGRDALGRPVTSGVYIYRLRTGSFVEVRRCCCYGDFLLCINSWRLFDSLSWKLV